MTGAPAIATPVNEAFEDISAEHPRLLIPASEVPDWRQRVQNDSSLSRVAEYVIGGADGILQTKPAERVKIGRRLLHTSRLVLKRVLYLATAYLLTEEERYAKRGIAEMLAATDFSDWNPHHFLDVAEMSAALGIGYDTFYPIMTAEERKTVETAIVEQALKPSLSGTKYNFWINETHNWNQVCHGGLAIGGLAIYPDASRIVEQVLERSVEKLPLAMHEYAPDGAYPEGPGYWEYGTTYNVLFLDLLTNALGTDFGLSQLPGFLESSDYYQHVEGPTGHFFNYSDSGLGKGATPAMYWFAKRRGNPTLLWNEKARLEELLTAPFDPDKDNARFVPLILFWASETPPPEAPTRTHWQGDGEVPVAIHRSSWRPDATFVAIKGGAPSANHGHMDIGSFVLDMNGERWAWDLGKESYGAMEQAGLQIWDRAQSSDRWKVFAHSSHAHNVPVLNGELQDVKGRSEIVKSKGAPEQATTVDLSPNYYRELERVVRTIRMPSEGKVVISDQFLTGKKSVDLRWSFVTKADVRIEDPGTALLQQNNHSVTVRILAPENVVWKLTDISEPKHAYEKSARDSNSLDSKQPFPRKPSAPSQSPLRPLIRAFSS